MTRLDVSLNATGPLFDGRATKTLQQATQNTIQELVEIGGERISGEARPEPGGKFLSVSEAKRGQASTGNYRRNLSEKVKNLVGIITDGGVIYGPWLEGTSSRNQTTRFKGYAIFRRTRQWLQGQAGRVLEKNVRKAVRRMGGR